MQPDLALAAINAVRSDHLYGHTCTDGKWYNINAGTRTGCPILAHLNTARSQVERLATQVLYAASSPRHIDAVAAALTATPLSELDAEVAENWRGMAKQAINALHVSLTGSSALTDRARAAAERLG